MFQVKRAGKVHDVVVIGSGAGGGTVTKVLADLGVSVPLALAVAHAESYFDPRAESSAGARGESNPPR